MAVIEARDGAVFFNGVFKDPVGAALLLAEFRRPLPAGDWFQAGAREIADRLEAAMRAAGYLPQRRIAA